MNVASINDHTLLRAATHPVLVERLCAEGASELYVVVALGAIRTGMVEKERICRSIVAAGADFVKTSTGFADGATVAEVAVLSSLVDSHAKVRACGGIRTADEVMASKSCCRFLIMHLDTDLLGAMFGVTTTAQRAHS